MPPNSTTQDPRIVVLIIWGALFSATLLYGVLIFTLEPSSQGLDPATTRLFTLLGVVQFAAVFVARHFLSRPPKKTLSATEQTAAFVRNHVIIFAIAESIAIYGLVLHFIGATRALSLQFIALGLVALALNAPLQILKRRT